MSKHVYLPGLTTHSITVAFKESECADTYIVNPTGAADMGPALRGILTGPGKTIRLGAGQFNIRSTIPLAYSGTRIIGAGHHATTIMIDDTLGNIGDAFTIDSIHGCTISNLTIDALSQRAAGRAVAVLGGDTTVKLPSYNISRAQHVIDIDMNNQYDGIVALDKSSTNGIWGLSIGGDANRFNLYRNHATGRFPIDINTPHGASIEVHQAWIVGPSNYADGPVGIRIRGSGDTSLIGVRTFGVQTGLLIDPQVNGAESVMAIDVTSCYFDASYGSCCRFNPIAGLTVPIVATVSNTWFATSTTTHAVHGSNGTGHSVAFNGCAFLNAAAYGLAGDTGCDATTFGVNNANFGPPLSNTSGTTSYT